MEVARHRPEGPGRSGFVGREHELAELEAGVAAAIAGRGSLLLVTGQAGVGKTRLAEELAARAAARAVVPLWGRAWEGEGAPPFWPWVQVVRAHLRGTGPEPAAPAVGRVAPWIARLVPEVRASLPEPAAPPPLDSGSARIGLFDAMTGFLHAASDARTLLLIFDDLHWADAPSLLLLQFLVQRIADRRLAVVGTYRAAAARQTPAVARTLSALGRNARHVPLRGLSEEEVGSFVAGIARRPAPASVVRTIHRATEGNPFFVDEVVRLLLAERDLAGWDAAAVAGLPVPQAVREAIRRRLEPLPEGCRAALAEASALGREFDLEVLAGASGLAVADARAVLAPALAAEILTPARRGRQRYAFSHALVREALYDELSPAQASRLHHAIATILEQRHAAHPERHLQELAHHFAAAAAGGAAAKAIDYATRAGDRAMTLLAYEDAAFQYERALRLLSLQVDVPSALRARLLLALGEAQDRSGRYAEAKRSLAAAADVARGGAERSLLARAALAFASVGPRALTEPWHCDTAVVALLREALAGLSDGDDVLRARLLARLARELYWMAGGREESAVLARRSIELARRLGDPSTLAQALLARGISIDSMDDVGERLSIAGEILDRPDAERDREHSVIALLWRIGNRFELGDAATLESDVPAVIRLIDELREPRYLWQARGLEAQLALMRGRFADVERLAPEILAAGESADVVRAFVGALLFVLRREQGRLGELADMIRGWVAERPQAHAWRAGLACLLVETGHEAAARAEIEAIDRVGFERLPRDMTWPTAMALLAEACAGLGDAGRAARIREILLPYRGRNVLIGDATAFFLGPVAYYLGRLDTVAARPDEAVDHLDRAMDTCARLGAVPFLARARLACADALLSRGASGDRERARTLALTAESAARALGMERLLAAAELLARRAHEPTPPLDATARGAASAVFRREGQIWLLEYRGRAARLQDMKGLRLLAVLLRHPRESIHALELTESSPWRDVKQRAEHGGGAAGGDAGATLDAQAKRAYRHRLDDLRAQLEEADEHNDLGRGEQLRGEIAFLAGELAGAFGLGGRERRVKSLAERARLNVTRTIQAAIRRIAESHDELGAHLGSTIRTGTFCSYDPELAPPIDWRL